MDRVFASGAGAGAGSNPPETSSGEPQELAVAVSAGNSFAVVSIPALRTPRAEGKEQTGFWKSAREAAEAFGPILQTAITVGLGTWLAFYLTGRFELAMKQRQLELANVQELRQTYAHMLTDSTSAASELSDAFALALFRDYAIMPLIISMQSNNPYRWEAAENGLRAIAMTDSQTVARQMLRVLKNRSQLYSWRSQLAAIDILGEIDCRAAISVLRDYRAQVLDENAAKMLEKLKARVSPLPEPGADDGQKLRDAVDRALRSLRPDSATSLRVREDDRDHRGELVGRWWAALASLVLPRAAEAQALPPCSVMGTSEYRFHFDSSIADAMQNQAIVDPLLRRVANGLAGALVSLQACKYASESDCPPTAEPLPCSNRKPQNPSQFDSSELLALDDGHVLLESWVTLAPAEDDHGQPIARVVVEYVLVPVARQLGSAGKSCASVAFAESLAVGCKPEVIQKRVAQSSELRGLAFTCSGVKLLKAQDYDRAWGAFIEARGALKEIHRPARIRSMAPLLAYIDKEARETAHRAAADAANPSRIGKKSPHDVDLALSDLP